MAENRKVGGSIPSLPTTEAQVRPYLVAWPACFACPPGHSWAARTTRAVQGREALIRLRRGERSAARHGSRDCTKRDSIHGGRYTHRRGIERDLTLLVEAEQTRDFVIEEPADVHRAEAQRGCHQVEILCDVAGL